MGVVVQAGWQYHCVPNSAALGHFNQATALQGNRHMLIGEVGPATVRATVGDPAQNGELAGIKWSVKGHFDIEHGLIRRKLRLVRPSSALWRGVAAAAFPLGVEASIRLYADRPIPCCLSAPRRRARARGLGRISSGR